ncbi:Clan CA, family C1, cathepsin L-like cysteine peptidase [Trichomonas vaginalis G3]|uniref:Clan CA, family C1, cathepsin L-like cysteine peptidase n=2 Tax=Trichomonas vaginalis TaxID=5722 RepID=A2EED5_TRIV3|nr:cysteine-type peptidase protein [Trichomonas vaginalis G3]EAY08941.1 Clan CA, family C1, cathepsin L-like cysteine peptidase [Trichomonas vaginalis G3]KAI5508610.1 cysteine-type peptidase protein [Trichomonas vaginalis G3]|eukprot:XP_001321164.1 Clan CA, family C1, cathepsin L-like cysteine peptidase [Trichomonas vaginalis G3]
MVLSFLFASLCLSENLPLWPKTYHLRGKWQIPYQKINIPFLVQTDLKKNRQSETSYENLLNEIHILGTGVYQLQVSSEVGPTCHLSPVDDPDDDELTEYLPTDNKQWKYKGTTVINGKEAKYWQYDYEGIDRWYNRFYVEKNTNTPLRYLMNGPSIRGSHASVYIFDIEDFGPELDESLFLVPNGCINSTESSGRRRRDLSRPRLPKGSNAETCPTYDQKVIQNLPESFSWRNVPYVLEYPHDQAVCGTCFAFGASEAINGQFSLRANRSIITSVQQLVDCTWGTINYACDGGEHDEIYRILRESKMELTLEDEYPYLGVGSYCGKNFKHTVGYVKGCYKIPEHDNEKLKSALFEHGPLAVGIIADQDGFGTLTDNIYDNANCYVHDKVKIDHSVLLTGWKRINGVDAWEIMNSWSDVWGDHGFGYIVMGDHDCGITEDVFFPIVHFEEKFY